MNALEMMAVNQAITILADAQIAQRKLLDYQHKHFHHEKQPGHITSPEYGLFEAINNVGKQIREMNSLLYALKDNKTTS